MERSSRQRISKVEKLLSKAEELVAIALKKRKDRYEELVQSLDWRPQAAMHATAVAAIAIYGHPKIDEPLLRAWARTLRRHRITIRNEYGREYQYEHGHEHEHRERYEYEKELKDAARELYPIIMEGANPTEKFTEIFRTAPVWLLEFTWMRWDASLLNFDLPAMSDKQVWGEQGLADMLRWPLLPLGMMTDGDPIPDALENGVAPEHDERSRQLRRIHNFIDRRRLRDVPAREQSWPYSLPIVRGHSQPSFFSHVR
jgi:hypothetical protein